MTLRVGNRLKVKRVRAAITRQNSLMLRKCDTRKSTKQTWAKVRHILGRDSTRVYEPVGIDAHKLNNHYAVISTDSNYTEPRAKLTVHDSGDLLTETETFNMLDHLKTSAAGLDAIPAWFLRLGAPAFAAPLTVLLNQSFSTSVVPKQWKVACITPVPKVAKPAQCSDYRPISVTPILSRLAERYIVRSFIYPSLLQPPPSLDFSDQYAFRPSGSTTAALVALLHTVCDMLATNNFVHVIALDFSKAFDSVRHSTLMEKIAQLEMPDQVYNWIRNFFSGHSHCTKLGGEVSSSLEVTASIIQGSGLGPAAYTVNAADLRPRHTGNAIVKYADDTYLIIPGAYYHTRDDEVLNVKAWAATNNLKLNCSKSREIVFRSRRIRGRSEQSAPPCVDIERVDKLTVLGVLVNNSLTATDHVSTVLASCASLMYALRVLRSHGLSEQSLKDVFQATVLGKLLYSAPAWSGFCSAADCTRLNSFLRRCDKLGYTDKHYSDISTMFQEADDAMFRTILCNTSHVLHTFLSERPETTYSLRTRSHNKQLIPKTSDLGDRHFIIRSLYKNLY